MRGSLKSIIGILCLAVSAAKPALAWEIPLTVENPSRTGVPPYISGGVPLLAGQAKDTADLRLAVKGPDGKLAAIPAQFRVLARWWRGDNSIRWVLVDCLSAPVPGEKKTVYLTNATLDVPSRKATLTVEDGADAIVISTGVAKFTVNKKKFNFLQSAVVDGEELLDGSPDLGTVIEDTFAERYYGSEGVREVAVLENGPVRVCVRARGQHLARGRKGYSRGMYGYDVFMNFYAGSSDVSLDVVITNNSQTSIGSPTFKDASLLLKLKGGAANYSLWGDKPVEGKLAAGESVCLYQDSNGADTWEKCPGFGSMNTDGWSPLPNRITSFRGYKVFKHVAGKEEELAAGSQARGLLQAWNERGGLIVQTRHFWQQFPKAAEIGADGTARVGLFPRECRVPHYLEDASAKGHEVILHFRRAKAGAAPEAPADSWDQVARLRPELQHMAATGALAELGPYDVPTDGLTEKPTYKTAIDSKSMLQGDALYGNAYGWQIFGERWRSNGGHSRHGARQPQKEDCYLFRWYLTGFPEWLAAGDARSRQYRDVRQYRIDDQDALAFKNWEEFKKANLRESGFCSRPVPNDEESKKYREGFWGRSSWELPNPEHTTLDLLYDRYLLFGDVRAFENMRIVAAHGVFYAIAAAPQVGRHTGWSWRAFDRYWDLTGDKRADELYKELRKSYVSLIGKVPLVAPGTKPDGRDGLTLKWCHAVAVATLHTGDPQMLELAKTAAEGKEKNGDYLCDFFAVLYHLTGEQKYKDAVLEKTDGGAKLLRFTVGDDTFMPPAAHWLLTQPPRAAK